MDYWNEEDSDNIVCPYCKGETGNLEVASTRAISASEKEIATKPTYVDREYGVFECPNCKEYIYAENSLKEHKYCLNCGQKMDWSDL